MENIKLESTHNTRDLCCLTTKDGYRIKANKLIRSGSLIRLTDNDIKTLKELGLQVVIDFRSEKEFVNKPDVRIENVEYINLPALPKNNLKEDKNSHGDSNLLQLVDKKTGGKKFLMNTYKNLFLTKEGLSAYKEFFKIILNGSDGAILWHCSQGKDRAGMAAFLLEYALGVSMEDCITDYLYTNVAMTLKIKELTPIVLRLSNNDFSLLPYLREVFSADIDYLNKSLDSIKKHYKSLDNFIINILEVDINKLKEMYLEK